MAKISYKCSVNNLLSYILVLFIILQTNSVYDVTIGHMGRVSDLFSVVLISVVLFYIIKLKKIPYGWLLYSILLFLYFSLFFIMNVRFSGYIKTFLNFAVVIIFLTGYLVLEKASPRTLYCYQSMILFIAVISLLFWSLGSIAHVFKPTGMAYIRWGGDKYINSYLNLYFEAQKEYYLGIGIYRNTAVFTEAPMFALNLLLAFLIECFFKEKVNRKTIFLLALTMFSTFSFMGIIFMGLILCTKWFEFKQYDFIQMAKWGIGMIVIVIVILFVHSIILNKVSDSISRIDDYLAGFKTWKENVFWGTGFYNNERLIANMSAHRLYNVGFSNAVMRLLAQSGLYMAFLYLIPLFISLKHKAKDVKKAGIFLACIYSSLLCTYSYNFLLFICFAYASAIVSVNKNGKKGME